ncbi:hypothetical protein LRS10_21860 [Phenylobacterium sp. J426]|uniref:hypothetical protein n=1 Tax=Phenylobacterium sp. J426 TaxID=2898439 RepID=UPI002151A017|nr:hypothetical protein [Phenylobacterium sp. J426]MCR5876557.1 hypothetical protein [Phenylobacterium sp. J426]
MPHRLHVEPRAGAAIKLSVSSMSGYRTAILMTCEERLRLAQAIEHACLRAMAEAVEVVATTAEPG